LQPPSPQCQALLGLHLHSPAAPAAAAVAAAAFGMLFVWVPAAPWLLQPADGRVHLDPGARCWPGGVAWTGMAKKERGGEGDDVGSEE